MKKLICKLFGHKFPNNIQLFVSDNKGIFSLYCTRCNKIIHKFDADERILQNGLYIFRKNVF